jgi:hypothetical protein
LPRRNIRARMSARAQIAGRNQFKPLQRAKARCRCAASLRGTFMPVCGNALNQP